MDMRTSEAEKRYEYHMNSMADVAPEKRRRRSRTNNKNSKKRW